MPSPDTTGLFPPRLIEVMADLSAVVFRREMDAEGTIRYPWISDNVGIILGFTPLEMTVTGKGALNALHWADRDAQVAAILRSAETMGPCRESFRAITARGETRWFLGSSAPTRQADGRVAWDGAWIDISPWMRAEHQFQTVMDHAEDVILTLDAQQGISWANAAAERLFGWGNDELQGRCLAEMLDQPCRGGGQYRVAECCVDLLQCFPRGSQEVMGRRKDGTVFPFEMTVSEVRSDGRLSLIVIGRDIIRRKCTELMLEETEHRLRSIAGNLPGVVFQRVLDPDGGFHYPYVSDGIEEILGHDAGDIVMNASLLFDAILPADRERLLKDLRLSAKTMEPADEDVRVRGPNGRMRWLSGQSRPRRRGDTIVWDGLLLDVTDGVEERVAAERAIRDSEERLRQAFDAASLGIAVTTLDGAIRQVNPAFEAMCGAEAGDLVGHDVHRFISVEHLPRAEEMPAPGNSFCLECRPHLPNGVERHWRITGTLFSASQDDAQPSLLVMIEDVTEALRAAEGRRQLELALTEGQKLEALGRLAGGVAHELNNMLGPILMAAEMITRSTRLDDRNVERCQRIIDAAKHGRDIVRNVLAYCRKETKTLAPVDLVPVFRQFAALAASILPPSVKVETSIAPAEAMVVGDAGQLTQVLLNLVNNARDAMDGIGVLLLTLDRVAPGALSPARPPRQRRLALGEPRDDTQPDPFATLDPARPHIAIAIRDTGCGMRAETAAKIFDPFFTTKPIGQGTGLGLSVVQGIVKAMDGAIAVDSTLGEGTTFRIVLPEVTD